MARPCHWYNHFISGKIVMHIIHYIENKQYEGRHNLFISLLMHTMYCIQYKYEYCT